MSPSDQQHLLAIEINALRMTEIATLRRECAFWREQCQLLGRLVDQLQAEQQRPSGQMAVRNGEEPLS